MNIQKILLLLTFACSVTLRAQQPVELQGQLSAPISTRTSNTNDRFTVLVNSPPQYEGAILNGRITQVNAPQRGMGKGKPSIGFQFDSITVNNATSPIGAELETVSNSKGVKGVDEEGRAVGSTSNKKRVLSTFIGAGLGAAIGATQGAQAAAKGAAVGGAAGLVIGLTMTTSGSDIEFFPGSLMTVKLNAVKK